jgi:hypothetical protein
MTSASADSVFLEHGIQRGVIDAEKATHLKNYKLQQRNLQTIHKQWM